jgi:hypothetical protein
MKRSKSQPLKDVLEDYVKALKKMSPKYGEAQIVNAWQQIVPKPIFMATKNIYLKDGTLFVSFNSSVVRQEMYMVKDGLIRHLNDAAGQELVKEIVLR